MARKLKGKKVAAALEPEQTVTIYEDPVTCRRSEGKAQIIQRLETIEPGIDRYLVHFLADPRGQNVERIIVNPVIG